VPRAGTRVGGDPRYARPDDVAAAEELLLNARFTVTELLRNGITTFVEFGSQLKVQEALDVDCLWADVPDHRGALPYRRPKTSSRGSSPVRAARAIMSRLHPPQAIKGIAKD
jgi:hypothetical protein